MNIAIIGKGRMGVRLADLLGAAGETVALLGRGGVVPPDATVVILAVPTPEVSAALAAAGDMSGKVIVDMTNPIGPDLTLTKGTTTSTAEDIQAKHPGAKVVKAFNTVFAELLDLDTSENANPPQVMLCGDDLAAKATVRRMVEALGFEPYDCGPLLVSRFLEPIGGLIVHLAYGQGRGTRIAPRLDQY